MKKNTLLTALFLLAISGLMLQYRIHNFMVADKMNPGSFIFDSPKFMATLFPLIDAILVTAPFMTRKTAVYGYLLNGLIVIFGTIFMAHFSIAVEPATYALEVTLVFTTVQTLRAVCARMYTMLSARPFCRPPASNLRRGTLDKGFEALPGGNLSLWSCAPVPSQDVTSAGFAATQLLVAM